MNWSAGKIGTINQRLAHANSLSTPPIGCVLHLLGLPGGGNKIYDRSPYANIGSIIGAVWKRLPSGLWVLDFDGNDDYVDCGNNESLNPLSAVTAELWFNPSKPYTDLANVVGHMIIKNGVWAMEWSRNDGRMWFYLDDSGSTRHSGAGNTVYQPNTSYHIAMTYDGQYLRFYTNGAEDATPLEFTDTIKDVPTANVYITTSGYPFPGLIALPKVYNRALSALEIQNSFNREKHLLGVW